LECKLAPFLAQISVQINSLVYNSLEQANSINAEIHKRMAMGPVHAELDLAPEGVTIN
jgi:hypothetical protein